MSFEITQPLVTDELPSQIKRNPKIRRVRRVWRRLQSFRRAMDLLPDAIILIGRNSKKIIDVNYTACRTLGYSKRELLGVQSGQIMPDIPWEYLEAHAKLDQKEPASPVVICTMQRRKDGREFPAQWTGMIVPTEKEPLWIVCSRQVPLGSGEKSLSLSLTPLGHDSLTGLPDRRLFSIRLDRAFDGASRQENHAFAVLFIDLDRFKNVNDTFGHMAGDHILCEVAWRLVDCIRPGDMVARYGGDEFTVFIDRLEDESTALRIAQRISDRLKQPVAFDGREASIAGSIGIAFSWQNYSCSEDMLNDADQAMYRAKAKGKSSYEVYNCHEGKFPHKPR